MKNIDRVFLNGSFVNSNEAQVSAFDRGFIFGDGVYEVIPVFGGRPFRLQAHLQRLDNNLGELGIKLDMSHQQWANILNQLINNNNEDQSVYIQVTMDSVIRNLNSLIRQNITTFPFSFRKKGEKE